jgi:hypothetical protein
MKDLLLAVKGIINTATKPGDIILLVIKPEIDDFDSSITKNLLQLVAAKDHNLKIVLTSAKPRLVL